MIEKEQWSYPAWLTSEDAAAARQRMVQQGVLYGGRESYHHMCRYFSGFFYRHKLLQKYDYYWRMEPDVHYYCDLDYDPFLYMQVWATSTGCMMMGAPSRLDRCVDAPSAVVGLAGPCNWSGLAVSVAWLVGSDPLESRLWPVPMPASCACAVLMPPRLAHTQHQHS